MKTRILGIAATLGAGALMLGIGASSPALAQDRGDWRNVRHESRDIQRDYNRLHDLEYRRDQEARRHDWHDVRVLDNQIADLRRHIERDRHEVNRDRDRSYYRGDRDRDDWRWR
jgi:hypothetical protein